MSALMRAGALECSRHTRGFSSAWKQQRDMDMYANRAVLEGMRSRAAYKLEEIDKKFGRFLRRGAHVVDLGSAPGGFSLVAAKLIDVDRSLHRWNVLQDETKGHEPADIRRTIGGTQKRRRHGRLVCVDVQDMEPIHGAFFVRGDMSSEETQQKILSALHGCEADVMISDMAPFTSGQKETDHYRIMNLADKALDVGQKVLRNGGTFCCKVFSGTDEKSFREKLQATFVKVKAFKPAASRKFSKELYYVAQGFVPSHLQASDDVALLEDLREEALHTSKA